MNQIIECSNEMKQKIIDTLSPETPWFESVTLADMNASAKKLDQKMQLTGVLISSLNSCQHQGGFERRLSWYQDQVQKIENNTYVHENAVTDFHDKSAKEYKDNYNSFHSSLLSYTPQNENEKNFHDSGFEILKQINKIIANQGDLATMKPKNLSQLNRVLEDCTQAFDVITQGGDIEPISQELAKLSQEVSGRASPKWQALGKGLLLFACAALVVAGVLAAIPSGGASLLLAAAGVAGAALVVGAAGLGTQAASSEKGLAQSVSYYKSAIKNLTNNDSIENNEEETPLIPK